MQKFDYHNYACKMRQHLSSENLVVPGTYQINHRYFNAKCNEYWSPNDQDLLIEGIAKYKDDYQKINEHMFKKKKFAVELQIRAEMLNKNTKEKKTKQFGGKSKGKNK